MILWRKSLLNTLMQIFIMLQHLVAEISRFKFDDYRVIRTGASDLKLFWAVYTYILTQNIHFVPQIFPQIYLIWFTVYAPFGVQRCRLTKSELCGS